MPKKRPISHRIGSQAVKIFSESLPENFSRNLTLDPVTENDYGIDGLLQIFQSEIHTGQTAFVQIKGQAKVREVAGKGIAFKISIEDITFFFNKLDSPLILILVDTSLKKVYWLDIQLDPLTSKNFVEARKSNAKTMTIYFNPKNTLPITMDSFIGAIQDSKSRIAERLEVSKARELAKSSHKKAIEKLDSYARDLVDIPGFSIIPQANTEAVMTTITSSGLSFSLYPNKSFRKGMEPKIKLRYKIPKEDTKNNLLLDSIKDSPENITQLPSEYIDSLEISSGDKTLAKYSDDSKDKNKLTVKVTQNTIDRIIYIRNRKTNFELRLNLQSWVVKGGKIKLKTPKKNTQLLNLEATVDPNTQSLLINFSANMYKGRDIKSFYNIIQLFNSSSMGIDFFLDDEGVKILIATHEDDLMSINPQFISLYEKLNNIQSHVLETIMVPDEAISKEDIILIETFDKVLKGDINQLELTLSLKNPKSEIKTGQAISMQMQTIRLLNSELTFKNKKVLTLIGKVGQVEKKQDLISIKVKTSNAKLENQK